MSLFRITYREVEQERRPPEEIEAVEFLVREPWIVFLDPSGACLSVRSEQVERVQRIGADPHRVVPEAPILRPPSDPMIPDLARTPRTA